MDADLVSPAVTTRDGLRQAGTFPLFTSLSFYSVRMG
jgi:hypothetical protein